MLFWCALAKASVVSGITSTYTPLGGNQWSLELNVANLGEPTPISEFTIYFSERHFTNLSLTGHPSTWDTIVIQPDLGIPAPGFLDGLVLDTSNALGIGTGQGGFALTFALLGPDQPFSLPFDLFDENLAPIGSGFTTVSINGVPGVGAVPEPRSVWLVLLGLVGASAAPCRSRAKHKATVCDSSATIRTARS